MKTPPTTDDEDEEMDNRCIDDTGFQLWAKRGPTVEVLVGGYFYDGQNGKCDQFRNLNLRDINLLNVKYLVKTDRIFITKGSILKATKPPRSWFPFDHNVRQKMAAKEYYFTLKRFDWSSSSYKHEIGIVLHLYLCL